MILRIFLPQVSQNRTRNGGFYGLDSHLCKKGRGDCDRNLLSLPTAKSGLRTVSN